jgi:hypothetical protein
VPRVQRDDQVDAELIRAVATSLRSWGEATGRDAPLKILREAVWFFWQEPRLARPRVPPKYPHAVPWSREAAAIALSADPRKGRLVIEHIEPLNRTLRWLVETNPSAATLARELPKRLDCVVVSRAVEAAARCRYTRGAVPRRGVEARRVPAARGPGTGLMRNERGNGLALAPRSPSLATMPLGRGVHPNRRAPRSPIAGELEARRSRAQRLLARVIEKFDTAL